MKAAVIFAVLIAWAINTQAISAEEKSNASRAIPWTAHISFSDFRLLSPTSGNAPYQYSLYEAITFQPLSRIWLHAGLRSRETLIPNTSQPMQQPADLKLAGMLELLPRHLYISGGGNIPYRLDSAKLADSAAYYTLFNDYNPFPEKDILFPGAVFGGAFAQYENSGWQTQMGIWSGRYSSMELYPNFIFSPSAFGTMSLRVNHEIEGRILNRTDMRLTLFFAETDRVKNQAHREGPLLQLRYGRKQKQKNINWELASGASFKLRDKNRMLRINSALQDAPFGDNYQSVYLEVNASKRMLKRSLLQVYMFPQYFYTLGDVSGWQNEVGFKWKFKLGENHDILLQAHYLMANMQQQLYNGIGFRLQYSFERIGVSEGDITQSSEK